MRNVPSEDQQISVHMELDQSRFIIVDIIFKSYIIIIIIMLVEERLSHDAARLLSGTSCRKAARR